MPTETPDEANLRTAAVAYADAWRVMRKADGAMQQSYWQLRAAIAALELHGTAVLPMIVGDQVIFRRATDSFEVQPVRRTFTPGGAADGQ